MTLHKASAKEEGGGGEERFKVKVFVESMAAMIRETSIVHRQGGEGRRDVHFSGEFTVAGDRKRNR